MGADETRTECPSLFEGFFRRHTASKWSSRRRMKTEQRSCDEAKISIDLYIKAAGDVKKSPWPRRC